MDEPTDPSNVKIPLPRFLKILTNSGMAVPKALAVAGKMYKAFNTPATLRQLTVVQLVAAGIDDKDDRRLVIAAVRKAGYSPPAKSSPSAGNSANSSGGRNIAETAFASFSSAPLNTVQVLTTPTKRKRKRVEDKNEFLPDGSIDAAAEYGSLDFNEIFDQEVLKTKSTVVNRAPLMTAWATIVAERIGFKREEALSIASVYTEMNAISKGVSLGLFEKGKEVGIEASKGGSQPYVDLIGRRVPLYQTQSSQWRALSNGSPVQPSVAFSYISRSLRQTTPHIMGSLRLLAESFGPQELNGKAWDLYADFRPVVDGWGKRAEVRCETILGLRKVLPIRTDDVDDGRRQVGEADLSTLSNVVKFEPVETGDGPETKKARTVTLEEYEAALDQDITFNEVDLAFDSQ